MTKEVPLWLQAGTYPARLDRNFISEVTRLQNRVFRGFVVTQRGAGANFSVDITAGTAVIQATSQANGGAWFVQSTATENVAVPATPGSPRTDSVIIRVRDPNAGGAAGNDFTLEVIAGTTVPDNALRLATIARTPGEPSILNAAITDTGPRGQWPWEVSTTAPTRPGIPGDLWVRV